MNRRNFLVLDPARPVTHAGPPGDRGPVAIPGDGTQASRPFARRSSTTLAPYTGPWSYAQAAHLLRRAMVGPTESEIRTAVADGMSATVARLMQPFEPATDEIASWAGQDPQFRSTAPQGSAEFQAFQQGIIQRREQLLKWWHRVISASPVSIQERMTLLWHNHFTSEMEVVGFAEWMHVQNQLLRRGGLGNFKQLVKEVTKDVAMLVYLDGVKNFKTGGRSSINENYARELMELFTCGVSDWNGNPNYTETDVVEAARALSGYNFRPSPKGANYVGLVSQFDENRWDKGVKNVLGRSGTWKADDVVEIVFSERADQTAKFVCEKIYRALVYDVPDREIVTEMAATFRSSGWEIRPVVGQLLRSEHFYDVTNIGALDKSPVEYVVGMIRGLGLKNIPDFTERPDSRLGRDLMGRLTTLGMQLFDPPNVKGWPGGRTWISTSTLPPRQKFALDVADGKIQGPNRAVFYALDALAFSRSFRTPGEAAPLVEDMSRFLLNTPPSQKESQMLLETLLDGAPVYEWQGMSDMQKDLRIRKFLKAIVQLAKFQLY